MNREITEIRKALAQNPPTAGSFEERRARWEPLFHKICPVPAWHRARHQLRPAGRAVNGSPPLACP